MAVSGHKAGRRILLVSHEASRSGAPRVAGLVARSLVREGHLLRILSRTAGPLLADFRAAAPTSIEPLHRARRRLRRLPGGKRAAQVADAIVAVAVIMASRPDIVYINSAAGAAYVRPARMLRRRVILHLHESANVAADFLPIGGRGLGAAELVACSSTVRSTSARLLGRAEGEIALVPSVPYADDVLCKATEVPDFPYDGEELVIGCCGTAEWRKGTDLWVQAARTVLRALPERRLRFVWVGDVRDAVETHPGEPIHFIGPRANPYAHMQRFDIATLPSRDDPFPLVVLESMALGVPVVAFGVGGVAQQVGDTGIVVRAGDVDQFASALVDLIEDGARRARLGTAARTRVGSLYSLRAFDEAVNGLVGRA